MKSRIVGWVQNYSWVGAIVLSSTVAVACAPVPSAESGVISSSPQSYEQGLADHLNSTGAVMYGAYWCPYCTRQKEMFKDAADQLPYVECDPAGENSQTQLCRDKGVQGFPSWEIQGKLYGGLRSPQELAELSGYAAPPPEP